MKIRAKICLNIHGLNWERVVTTKKDISLKDFLVDLSKRYDKMIRNLLFDSEEERLRSDYVVLLNGRHYFTFADQILTKLHDGDSVVILAPMVGG